jgi:hemerythrin-like domain-containing protein
MRRAAGGAPSDRVAAARSFVAFFDLHMVDHFRREEESVFPLIVDADGKSRQLLVRALLDHQRLRAFAKRLADELGAGPVGAQLLSETASLVESHVRLEERRLFPLVEQLAGERLGRVNPEQGPPRPA